MHMLHDRTYRISFVGALLLHFIVGIFLSIELTSLKRPASTSSSVNVIKAFAVSAHAAALNTQQPTKAQMPLPYVEPRAAASEEISVPQPVSIPKPTSQPKTPMLSKSALQQKLQKRMLQEMAAEARAAQKKLQAQQQVLEKLKQQQRQQHEQRALQKMLRGELAKESKQLTQQHQKLQTAMAKAEQAGSKSESVSKSSTTSQQDQGEIDKYKALIIQAIASEWIIPQGLENNDMCKLVINLGPGGVVLNIQVVQPSKNPLLLRATQAAIWKASPLPIPHESRLFSNFRTIQLTARPEGVTEE